jgi:hypothetical protein
MPISSVKNSRLSAIEVTGAPFGARARLPASMSLVCDALYTAFALTLFPIWRIRARNRKEKIEASRFRDDHEIAVQIPATAP